MQIEDNKRLYEMHNLLLLYSRIYATLIVVLDSCYVTANIQAVYFRLDRAIAEMENQNAI